MYGNDLYGEADNASGELIHHDHDPVGFEQDRLAAEEVCAPQAIVYGAQPGEPRGAAATSIGTEMLGENTAHQVFVHLDPEDSCDLARDSRTAESRIAFLGP